MLGYREGGAEESPGGRVERHESIVTEDGHVAIVGYGEAEKKVSVTLKATNSEGEVETTTLKLKVPDSETALEQIVQKLAQKFAPNSVTTVHVMEDESRVPKKIRRKASDGSGSIDESFVRRQRILIDGGYTKGGATVYQKVLSHTSDVKFLEDRNIGMAERLSRGGGGSSKCRCRRECGCYHSSSSKKGHFIGKGERRDSNISLSSVVELDGLENEGSGEGILWARTGDGRKVPLRVAAVRDDSSTDASISDRRHRKIRSFKKRKRQQGASCRGRRGIETTETRRRSAEVRRKQPTTKGGSTRAKSTAPTPSTHHFVSRESFEPQPAPSGGVIRRQEGPRPEKIGFEDHQRGYELSDGLLVRSSLILEKETASWDPRLQPSIGGAGSYPPSAPLSESMTPPRQKYLQGADEGSTSVGGSKGYRLEPEERLPQMTHPAEQQITGDGRPAYGSGAHPALPVDQISSRPGFGIGSEKIAVSGPSESRVVPLPVGGGSTVPEQPNEKRVGQLDAPSRPAPSERTQPGLQNGNAYRVPGSHRSPVTFPGSSRKDELIFRVPPSRSPSPPPHPGFLSPAPPAPHQPPSHLHPSDRPDSISPSEGRESLVPSDRVESLQPSERHQSLSPSGHPQSLSPSEAGAPSQAPSWFDPEADRPISAAPSDRRQSAAPPASPKPKTPLPSDRPPLPSDRPPLPSDRPGAPLPSDRPGAPLPSDRPGAPLPSDRPPLPSDRPGAPLPSDRPGAPLPSDRPPLPSDRPGAPLPVSPQPSDRRESLLPSERGQLSERPALPSDRRGSAQPSDRPSFGPPSHRPISPQPSDRPALPSERRGSAQPSARRESLLPSDRPGVPLPSDRPGVLLPSDRPGVPLPSDRPGVPLPSDRPSPGLPSDRPIAPLPSDRPGLPSDRRGSALPSERPVLPSDPLGSERLPKIVLPVPEAEPSRKGSTTRKSSMHSQHGELYKGEDMESEIPSSSKPLSPAVRDGEPYREIVAQHSPRLVVDEDGTTYQERVTVIEVPEYIEVIKKVPKKVQEFVEKKVRKIETKVVEKFVEVPRIEYVDHLEEIEEVQERVVYVPKKVIVDVPKERTQVVSRPPRMERRIVEKIVEKQNIIERHIPTVIEQTVKKYNFTDIEVPIVVAQTLHPIVVQADDYDEDQQAAVDGPPVTHILEESEPRLVMVDIFVPRPVHTGTYSAELAEINHQAVDIPPPQWNALLDKLNPEFRDQIQLLPYVRNEYGHIEKADSNAVEVPPGVAIGHWNAESGVKDLRTQDHANLRGIADVSSQGGDFAAAGVGVTEHGKARRKKRRSKSRRRVARSPCMAPARSELTLGSDTRGTSKRRSSRRTRSREDRAVSSNARRISRGAQPSGAIDESFAHSQEFRTFGAAASRAEYYESINTMSMISGPTTQRTQAAAARGGPSWCCQKNTAMSVSTNGAYSRFTSGAESRAESRSRSVMSRDRLSSTARDALSTAEQENEYRVQSRSSRRLVSKEPRSQSKPPLHSLPSKENRDRVVSSRGRLSHIASSGSRLRSLATQSTYALEPSSCCCPPPKA